MYNHNNNGEITEQDVNEGSEHAHMLSSAANNAYDIMTTSFIEDSSNPESNPFNGITNGNTNGNAEETATVTRKVNLNESENDLNKTHQLSDEECDQEASVNESHRDETELEEGEIANSFVIETQQQQQAPISHKKPSIDADALASVLETLNFEHQQNNQDHVHISSVSANVNDPGSWNLLQLPKPVNPNDVGVTHQVFLIQKCRIALPNV